MAGAPQPPRGQTAWSAREGKGQAEDAPNKRQRTSDGTGLHSVNQVAAPTLVPSATAPSLVPSATAPSLVPSVHSVPAPPLVQVWDLDETLVVFQSLLSGDYVRHWGLRAARGGASEGEGEAGKGAEAEEGMRLGRRWRDLILDVCDHHFLFETLQDLDPPSFSHVEAPSFSHVAPLPPGPMPGEPPGPSFAHAADRKHGVESVAERPEVAAGQGLHPSQLSDGLRKALLRCAQGDSGRAAEAAESTRAAESTGDAEATGATAAQVPGPGTPGNGPGLGDEVQRWLALCYAYVASQYRRGLGVPRSTGTVTGTCTGIGTGMGEGAGAGVGCGTPQVDAGLGGGLLSEEQRLEWEALYEETDAFTGGWLSAGRRLVASRGFEGTLKDGTPVELRMPSVGNSTSRGNSSSRAVKATERSAGLDADSTEDVAGTSRSRGGGDGAPVRYLVSSGQLIPTLVKLLLFKLDKSFPCSQVFSSKEVGKATCFRWIEERHQGHTGVTISTATTTAYTDTGADSSIIKANSDTDASHYSGVGERAPTFVAIGNGPAEEEAAMLFGWRFIPLGGVHCHLASLTIVD